MPDPTTPNMNLTLPVVTTTLGPTYAIEINDDLDILDAHTHAPGSGVQITPSGLNINTDLPAGGNTITGLKATAYNDQAAPLSSSLLERVYFSGNELYCNDGVGNAVKITLAGNVNVGSVGAITGMGGTSASVSYSDITKTFTFSQAANTAAHLSTGNLIVHQGAAALENAVTIKSPTSLAASYDFVLPTVLPGATLPLSISSSGQLSTAQIPTAAYADASVTEVKRAASAATSSGTVNLTGLTSTSAAAVTGATVTLTTFGRPVMVMLQGIDGAMASADGSVRITNGGANTSHAELSWSMDGGSTFKGKCFVLVESTLAVNGGYYPAGSICAILEPAAGSPTIALYYRITSGVGTPSLEVNNCKVVAREF